ncbi:MAG: helix-turn-helix domain-containing protein [Planctomycetes bacterium]|nr:helix-turn-helix domain-containing protein [Planctomycetota bacterium]
MTCPDDDRTAHEPPETRHSASRLPLAVDAKEAALILNISPRLLWTHTNCKEIPHVRIGRRLLYPVAALEAWLASRTTGKPRG